MPYNGKDNDNYEGAQFYYHPDHLGSSSFITNLDGDVTQHIEYVPFGEVFIEERNKVWNTPYLFNAKELDEETGLCYYGQNSSGTYGFIDSSGNLYSGTDAFLNSLTTALNDLRTGVMSVVLWCLI